MGKKAKTRFVAKVNGEIKEAFNARIASDGTLIILMRHATKHTYGTTPAATQTDVKEHRFSIHPMKQTGSRVNTIKQTYLLADGHLQENYFLSTAFSNRLIAPIFGRMCPDLRHERYNPPKRKKDTIVQFAKYDAKEQVLHHCVFVSLLDGPVKIKGSSLYNQISHDVGYYRITVLSCHTNFMSTPLGHISTLTTMNTRVDKAPSGKDFDIKNPGYTPEQASILALSMFREFHAIISKTIKNIEPRLPIREFEKAGPGLLTKNQFMKKCRKIARRRT